jgi:hypothetical protein
MGRTMAEIFSTCSTCGGPADTADDGRSIACRYCGARGRTAVDPAKIAASLRTDLAALGGFLEHLSTTLEASFPEQTVVRREGPLFRAKKVESLEVTLADSRFRLHRSHGSVRAEHGEAVRGIVLKSEELPLDRWIEHLCKALAAVSEESAAARSALGKIVGSQAK